MKKIFQYDGLVDRTNICNRKAEILKLNKMVENRQKIIIYAPRRYGKTSLVKNVITEDFTIGKKAVVIYINLMDVADIDSIAKRINSALTVAIQKYFPIKSWASSVGNFVRSFSVSISYDPITGAPALELKGSHSDNSHKLEDLLRAIKKIAEKHNLLIVLDEFQDIAYVPEATAILRTQLQEINNCSIVFLGSKRKMLADIFNSANSPFFNYGEEFNLNVIKPEEWLPYFNERLSPNKVMISKEGITFLTDLMCDVPNSICEVGFWLSQNANNLFITEKEIINSLNQMVESKEQSYRFQLSLFSEKEKSVIKEIARLKYVEQIGAKAFLNGVKPAASATRKSIEKLIKVGLLEWEYNKGYRLSDPLLRYFLLKYPL